MAMLYVFAGALAFVLLCAADLLFLRGTVVGKAAAFSAASASFVFGFAGSITMSRPLGLPHALRAAGWVLGAVTFLLVVFSLVVEVPTLYLYLTSGRERKLVTTGFYAMSRHPGVVWFSLFMVSLAAATDARTLAIATPVWIAMDVLHVTWQERVYLVRVYGDEYRRYQAEVPMLIPRLASIRRGIESLRRKTEAT
jgi:protein-S-isoprenylcysteine O-methyltransferase Ste14